MKWEEMCKHKDEGGMGFKDLTMFNEAMLAKLAWRLFNDDTSIFLIECLRLDFFPKGLFLMQMSLHQLPMRERVS